MLFEACALFRKPDVFLGAVFLAFVWVGLFIVLPAVTGKEGKLQEMQQRLDAAPDR